MKKAVIYSRVSSTTDRQSTERQVLDLKSYAQKNEFKVCKVFEEKISGAKKNERTPTNKGSIGKVVFWLKRNNIEISNEAFLNSFNSFSKSKELLQVGVPLALKRFCMSNPKSSCFSFNFGRRNIILGCYFSPVGNSPNYFIFNFCCTIV